jgi:hypothetical protein
VLPVPAAFFELIVYVFEPVAGGVTEKLLPVQAVLVVIPGPETLTVVPVSQFHVSWMLWPNVIAPGVALIVGLGTVTAAVTVTVAVAVAVPPEPVAVSVYVIVAVGLSVTVPLKLPLGTGLFTVPVAVSAHDVLLVQL